MLWFYHIIELRKNTSFFKIIFLMKCLLSIIYSDSEKHKTNGLRRSEGTYKIIWRFITVRNFTEGLLSILNRVVCLTIFLSKLIQNPVTRTAKSHHSITIRLNILQFAYTSYCSSNFPETLVNLQNTPFLKQNID